MSSFTNPRRTPVTRPDSEAGHGLRLKTNMALRKGATFHSPTTPPSSPPAPFRVPSLPRRSQTNLDDVVDAHRRRAALTLDGIDKALTSITIKDEPSSATRLNFPDDSLPVPKGFLDHTVVTDEMAREALALDPDRRVLRPRHNRRPSKQHESDSGLGTSIASTEKQKGAKASTSGPSAITRSVAAPQTTNLRRLSARAVNRIHEHTLKPLLAEKSFKDFRPIVLDCPRRIQEGQIVCLRDLEKTLIYLAPERTDKATLYFDFCRTSIQCIQATVEYLSDREQTRPRDRPYTNGYFIDLVEQIRQHAIQMQTSKEKQASGKELDEMDVDPTDEIKLHGGLALNGRPAELVRVKKDGKAYSMATGLLVEEVEEEGKGAIRFKRSMSEQAEDEEEIMRSMARRKKNASLAELAPKRCKEPGCHKEFKRPCDLTKHEKTHSRPWKCPIPTCKYHDYGWPTEKEMDRHVNDKHSANPAMYECLFKPCPYKSKRESNCKQHMEKAHNWTYQRTKTNGKKSSSKADSTAEPTPHLTNIPTPTSDHTNVMTPPDDHSYSMYPLEFPAYSTPEEFNATMPHHQSDFMSGDIQIDMSPIDSNTPSTNADQFNAYQDFSTNFSGQYDDIYGANHVQLPTPTHSTYGKGFTDSFNFTTAEYCPPQPAHISPVGQGNAVLYTPASLAEVDEGFEDFHSGDQSGNGDFVLFDSAHMTKSAEMDLLFGEVAPSLAAGYTQPQSQDFDYNQLDWNMDLNPFPSQH